MVTSSKALWDDKENYYLRRYYMVSTDEQLQRGLKNMLHSTRSILAIKGRLALLGLSGRGKKTKHQKPISGDSTKTREDIGVYIPKIKPYLKNKQLFQMLGEDWTLKDIARITGEHIDVLRGYIAQGGLPEEFVGHVRGVVGHNE